MAAKNVIFALYSGAEFTMQLFRKSAPDTLVATSSNVTHGTNFPELHTAIFSDVPEDDYLARIFDVEVNVSYETVTIGAATTNYVDSLKTPNIATLQASLDALNNKLSQRGVV